MLCAPGLIFVGTEGVGSYFHVLRSQTHFRWYRGRRLPFSCFARPNSFSAVPTASVPFSCFALPDTFSVVRRASGPVFIFCALELIFDGSEGVGSRFYVLHALTHFWRYRGRPRPFSCFTLPDSFSAIPRVACPIFMFCAPGLVFSVVTRALGPVFMFCAPGLIFGENEGVRSYFHVMCSWTHFRRYRGRRLPFSCFVCPNSFSAVPTASISAMRRASSPVFVFCAPGLIFDGSEGVGSRFHVLRPRTNFRRYHGRQVPFSYFALSDSFSAVPWESAPVFMFCAPELVSHGTEGVGSHFHILRARTHFRRYRGCEVPFSCFALPESFSALSRASTLVFMFCAPGLVFGGNKGVGSRFHVLRTRTLFQRYGGRPLPI
jgi:hypothetical protein